MLEAELAGTTQCCLLSSLTFKEMLNLNWLVVGEGQVSMQILGREKLAIQETSLFLLLNHNLKSISLPET